MRIRDRRYNQIAAKESTQRHISFYVISIICAVIAVLCLKGSIEDIKNVYNTLLPFLGLVLGFWLGSSKGAADNREQLNRLIQPPPPPTNAAMQENTDVTRSNTKAIEQNTDHQEEAAR